MGIGTEFGRPTGVGGGYEGYFKQPQYGFLEMGAQMLGRQLPTPQLEMPGRYRMQMDMQNRFRAMNREMLERSPTFEYIMTQGVGRMTGRSFEASKQLIQGNSMLRMIRSAGSYGWNMFASPYTDQYSQIPMMASEAYRQFAGTSIAGMGPGGQAQMGFTYNQSRQFATKLYEATRGASGVFQKGPFDARGMMEIASITQAYGGFANLGAGKGAGGGQMGGMEEMVRRTKDVAKVINLGMRVYGEMDKQKVVERIMELTRGTVGLQQTGSIETLLHRVDAMARTAGLSVDLMQKIAAEGADIARRVNVRGNVGAVQAMQAVVTANVATSGPNALVSQSMMNFLGGQNQVVRMMAGINTGFMQRANVQDLGALVGGGMLSTGQAQGLLNQGVNQFQMQNMIMSRAIAEARRQGRPTSDAYMIAATWRNPRLRMEGTSKMLEDMQEDPTGMMESQMSSIAGAIRGNMSGYSWARIMRARPEERESLLYEAMMRNPNAVIEAGGDPSNMLGIAHMLSKGLQGRGAKKLFMFSAEERRKMQDAATLQMSHQIENMTGIRDMEDRSVFERFQNVFTTSSGKGVAASALEAILPRGGRLGKEDVSEALLSQVGRISNADLTSAESARANALLGGSRMLTGGEDIFAAGRKGTVAYERLQYMRGIGRSFGGGIAAEGEKILGDNKNIDRMRQLVSDADAGGMDWDTVSEIEKLSGKKLDAKQMANVLKFLGASDTSIGTMRSVAAQYSGVLKAPGAADLEAKINKAEVGTILKDYKDARKKYNEETAEERKDAVKELRDFTGKMGGDISIGVSRQIEADRKMTNQERQDRDSQMRKVMQTIAGKTNVDDAIKGLAGKGSMKEVIAGITQMIDENKDLTPEQIQALQGQIGNVAQYVAERDKSSAAYKEVTAGYREKRKLVSGKVRESYDELKKAQEALEAAEKGKDDDKIDKAFDAVSKAKKEFDKQKDEFKKYGATEKELKGYKDIGPDMLTEIVHLLKSFFRDARGHMKGQGQADAGPAGEKTRSATK
jgi:uncharacterized protein YbjQ (UPF0145 family)